jgi:uncharacterized membrane protein YkoI
MEPVMKAFRIIIMAALAAALTLVRVAFAGDDDHERARRAVERGEAMPLSQVLDSVSAKVGGEVVGVEIDHEDGRYVYEFKVITPDGRLREVLVDALTAEILRHEDD